MFEILAKCNALESESDILLRNFYYLVRQFLNLDRNGIGFGQLFDFCFTGCKMSNPLYFIQVVYAVGGPNFLGFPLALLARGAALLKSDTIFLTKSHFCQIFP